MPSDADVTALRAHVERTLPAEWPAWPGVWHGQAELALLDAVLSISARYGGEGTGVRRAVKAYRDREGATGADDLTVLAGFAPEELADVLGNRQRVSGRSKAEAVVEAACNFTRLTPPVVHADDLRPEKDEHRRAYTGVHGLGKQTWHYFCMLLGKPDVKADRWIIRFVDEALGRPTTAAEAHALVHAAAERLDRSPTDVDHAIWHTMSRRR